MRFGYLQQLFAFAWVGWVSLAAGPASGAPVDTLTRQLEQDSALFAVLVADSRATRYRQFFHGRRPEQVGNVQSVGKSVMALLVGIALDQGALRSLEQPLGDFFPELRLTADTVKHRLTVRHLLDQTSGLRAMEYPELEDWLALPDPTAWLLRQPLVSVPGERYAYNSAATHLLSAVLTKATEMPVDTFAMRYLFRPLGIREVRWEKRRDGYPDGAGLGLWLRPDDMVRLGQLLLAKGKWGGRRVLSADWCRALADPTGKRPAPWGLAGSRHGLAWYSATCKGQAVTYAMGYGGQYILLLPQRQRLIVVQHAHDTPRGIENNTFFLEKLLPRLVAFAEKP